MLMEIGGHIPQLPNTARRAAAALLFVAAMGGAAETASARGLDCADPDYQAAQPAQGGAMLCRLNAVRTTPLAEDPELDAAAEEKLDEIMQYRHVSHTPDPTDPSPFTPLKDNKALIPPWSIGENIAIGAGSLGGARAIFSDWWWSPSHRANILNGAFTGVGFAERHIPRIIMDVDQEYGPTIEHETLTDETIWVTEFWGP
jgi:uncharacterized protein YkwD